MIFERYVAYIVDIEPECNFNKEDFVKVTSENLLDIMYDIEKNNKTIYNDYFDEKFFQFGNFSDMQMKLIHLHMLQKFDEYLNLLSCIDDNTYVVYVHIDDDDMHNIICTQRILYEAMI